MTANFRNSVKLLAFLLDPRSATAGRRAASAEDRE
jgi:hypothetical protein